MNTEIHVAITRTVKPGCEEAFEKAIRTFFAESLKDTGTLGAQLLRPLPGSQGRTFGILRSFAGEQDREAFYRSDRFARWQEAVQPLVEEDYSRRNLHGLEAFFVDPGLIRHPPRWKMAIAIWMGVWPTVYVVSSLIGHRLSGWHPYLATGAITLLVVVALTWAVMPVLTRMMRPWLVRPTDTRSKERNGS
jgi:antibiotic biosynthesis monooxygenase (ABM) superfamily enzyme